MRIARLLALLRLETIALRLIVVRWLALLCLPHKHGVAALGGIHVGSLAGRERGRGLMVGGDPDGAYGVWRMSA